MTTILAALAVIAAATTAPPTGDYRGCPPQGSALSARGQRINVAKNRSRVPLAADYDATATLEALMAPGDDSGRWSDTRAARVTAVVVDVLPGSRETVNCGATDLERRDTLELALTIGAPDRERLVVEVTPRWREAVAAIGLDWSTAALRDLEGGCVEVAGWLFWDAYHYDEAENTAPGRPANWRATAWEIHPVTSIAAVACP